MAKNTQAPTRANQLQFGDFGGGRLTAGQSTTEIVACFVPQEDSVVSYVNAPDNGKSETVTERSYIGGIPVYGRLTGLTCVSGTIDFYNYE